MSINSKLTFNEERHTYCFDGTPMERSVTGALGKYFEKFDADVAVVKMMRSSNWPRPQYTHPDGVPFSEEEILKNWDNTGETARNKGK